jgi:hypothetical protein
VSFFVRFHCAASTYLLGEKHIGSMVYDIIQEKKAIAK